MAALTRRSYSEVLSHEPRFESTVQQGGGDPTEEAANEQDGEVVPVLGETAGSVGQDIR